MKKLIIAAVFAVMGAFVFVAGSPAQAAPAATTLGGVSKAAPHVNVTDVRCCRRRYYRRYYYYRPRYRWRRYYSYRRCHYYRRYGYLYRRCYFYR